MAQVLGTIIDDDRRHRAVLVDGGMNELVVEVVDNTTNIAVVDVGKIAGRSGKMRNAAGDVGRNGHIEHRCYEYGQSATVVLSGEQTLVGSSPEELVRLEGGIGSIAPIAGTRPRGSTPSEDRALEEELVADPKERAEHMMLVDLARNDLGRVSKTGSVRVEGLAHVERYSHVMHLVSNVYGEVDPEKADAMGLFRAAFPAGTLTGAPKIRAMELLAEFEKSPRGVYGGAAGYFSNTGDMNFAIVIRTMVLERGTLTMRAGAGIVAALSISSP
jgi:anthranilate/para-aminobenzoate synthase component I